ncbi:MAG: DUF2189 domain-containing protein [Gammaproteobacteria bacterium]
MNQHDPPSDLTGLPFVAPCSTLSAAAPFRWLRAGWHDYQRAWRASILYGIFMAIIIMSVCAAAWHYGGYVFAIAMIGGFVFLAPLTCTGLYAISAQLERNEPVSLRRALRAGFKRYLGNEMVFALVLLVIFLVWARAGTMVHVFFPANADASAREFITFFGIGTAVGAIFAALTFSASAFSLPMIVHRRVDAVTAVITSINAVLRNRLVMILWLTIAVAGLLIGLLTAGIGLIVTLPVIGHAAWHGYLETIDADAFPRHEAGVTAAPRPSP